MPCDQVRTHDVDLSKAPPEYLQKALEQMGFTRVSDGCYQSNGVTATVSAGSGVSFTTRYGNGFTELESNLRRTYAEVAIRSEARRKGWQVSGKNGKLQLTRGY